jgi:flagellar operon protein
MDRQANGVSGAASPSFADLLRARQGIASETPQADPNAVHFSAHAQTRLQSRQIVMRPDHIARLQSAVGRAEAKGSKDTLVLMDDMALVVSVKNRTVVTVVDKANLKQNVFTNIDSAVIA